MLEYNAISKETMGIDPLVECMTASSAAHLSFKTNFMEKDSICVVSDHGLLGETRISKLSETVLSFLEVTNNIKIESSLHGRETLVAGYKVDGFYRIKNGESLPMWPALPPGTDIVFEVKILKTCFVLNIHFA